MTEKGFSCSKYQVKKMIHEVVNAGPPTQILHMIANEYTDNAKAVASVKVLQSHVKVFLAIANVLDGLASALE